MAEKVAFLGLYKGDKVEVTQVGGQFVAKVYFGGETSPSGDITFPMDHELKIMDLGERRIRIQRMGERATY